MCLACAGEDGSGAKGAGEPDAGPGSDSGGDAADLPSSDAAVGPPCWTDDDCHGVFVGLGVCETARCGLEYVCVRAGVETGAPCDDGDLCVEGESCLSGECAGGTSLQCDDGNACTSDGCDPALGCIHTPATGPCQDDGNPCTSDEVCSGGQCLGTYHEDVAGCLCARDRDCPAPADACAGEMSCTSGRCELVPTGGVKCDTAFVGPCFAVACDPATGQCVESPADGECNDGNPCTPSDECDNGVCTSDPAANTCGCVADADCSAFDDGDVCNGSLFCAGGRCVVDPASVVTCEPEPAGSCLRSRCQPSTGLCKLESVVDGTSCNDDNACTLGDTCVAAECLGATAAHCGAPAGASPQCWSVPECQPEVGCQESETDGPCDDGMACTDGDHCIDGVCYQGEVAPDCDDGIPCTSDSCADAVGCVHEPDDAACDDGVSKPCTVDVCQPGAGCTHDVEPSLCTCKDEECTEEICLSDCSCFKFNTIEPCDDGDACTSGDTCQGGVCRPGDKVCPCNEDANCTVPGGGDCDGVWHCIANQCVLETAVASGCDGAPSPCTKTWCDPSSGTCKQSGLPDGTPCSDGTACTTGEACLAGQCVGGVAVSCSDGNPCTDDACSASAGCSHVANAAPCDDLDACTINDTCKSGACKSAKSICECKADDDCPKPANLCDGRERCLGNTCQLDSATIVTCADPGPCLGASCVPQTGQCVMLKKAEDAPCSDGDACTSGETCHAGTCSGGTLVDCDDASVCTNDACDPLIGCVNSATAGPCNDGDPCTASEACKGGACVATTSLCVEACANGVDDDGDGHVDCVDPDCAGLPGCDACASGAWIACGTPVVQGWAGGATSSAIGSTGCGPAPFAGHVYRFTTTASGPVTLQLLDGADEFTLHVLTSGGGGGCDPASCVTSGSLVTFAAAAGKVYHVDVEALGPAASPAFALAVTCAVPCAPACDGGCGPDGCGGLCPETCEDGDACTLDTCAGGGCAHLPLKGCCSTDANCDDGDACTTDTCALQKCAHKAEAGCCTTGADCDDGDMCTMETCDNGQCVWSTSPGCCATDAECGPAGPCETLICAFGMCLATKPPGCCATAADCAKGAGPCEIAQCTKGQCVLTPVAGCCDAASDCDDGDVCTYDICDVALEVCQHVPAPGCCAVASDCPDDGNPCTTSVCKSGGCTQTSASNCCDSDSDCTPKGPCEAAACVSSQCVSTPLAGCCASAAQCDDGDACTADACSAGQCVNASIVGCCKAASQCGDSDLCTVDTCAGGKCAHALVPGCCASDFDCADADACTKDTCAGGTCAHTDIPKCCKTAADCKPGPCIKATCSAGQCSYTGAGSCCDEDSDCMPLGPSCTKGLCVQGTCKLTIVPDCCVTSKDCAPSGPCKKASCTLGPVAGTCVEEDLPGCCSADADCTGPVGPCEKAICLGHACVAQTVPGCCQTTGDCAPDVEPCTITACSAPAESCQTVIDPGCCASDADCAPAAPGTCQSNVCELGVCVAKDLPGCCKDDDDCTAAAKGPCEAMGCFLGQCVVVGHKPGCCVSATQCPVTIEPCAHSACVGGACVTVPVPGCCGDSADCPSPVKPCRAAVCDQGKCGVANVAGCCASDADCADDGNACTAVTCQSGVCVSAPVAGCCLADADCTADGPCTRGRCLAHTCTTAPVPGCCVADADCPTSADPCRATACHAGACLDLPLPGCCTSDLDCPEDADPCTAAKCQSGACAWLAAPGCCDEPADCPPSPDPCAPATCTVGTCGEDVQPGCALGACSFMGWDDLSASGWSAATNAAGLGWAPSQDDVYAGTGSLRATFPVGTVLTDLEATSPRVTIDGETRLRFRYKLTLAAGDCQAGRLAVRVHLYGVSANLPIWDSCLPSDDWRLAVIDLAPFAGQSLDVVFVLSTGFAGSGGAAWVDDVAITGACRLECKGAGCEDGNACTADTCEAGVCQSSPVAGCCETDLACADDDPCTSDACGPDGACAHGLEPGCAAGACLAESFSSAVPESWKVTATDPSFAFVPSTAKSIGPGAHLAAIAGPEAAGHTTSLALPPALVSADSPVVRFALRQEVGPACELGRLVAEVNGEDHPLPCGSHAWRAMAVPTMAPAGTVLRVVLRAEAATAGAALEIDDVRITGACHVLECEAASDCAAASPCALSACDAGFACTAVAAPDCCSKADPCPAGPCTSCKSGSCVTQDAPGCAGGACWLESFQNGTMYGWQIDAGVWSISDAALSPPSALHGLATAPATGTARLPSLLVGSGLTRLRFDYTLTLGAADPACVAGALELWADGDLLWHDCDGQDDVATVDVPLGAYVGRVVRPELRLRSSMAGTAVAVVDDVRVTGFCAVAECSSAADCQDGNPCTDDECLGLVCFHATNQVPCDDGDACTTLDTCGGGTCHAQPLVCYDGEPCTDDLCDSAVGCLFQPGSGACDDGDPCTAGDACEAGTCTGTSILCKDFNGCTRDGCTPGVGCEFAPEAFGTTCRDGGAMYGMCWDGACTDWKVSLSESAGTASDTRAFAASERASLVPILVAGTHDPDGAARASLFRIDAQTLALQAIPESETNAPSLYALHDALAVGAGGTIISTTPDVAPPHPIKDLAIDPALGLHAVTSVGATWFLGGDGSAVGPVQSTLRRCKLSPAGWTCHRMPVVHSPGSCSRQVPFHVRAVLPLTPQKVLVAGMSIQYGNEVARVAVWDGNTFDDCPGLGVYSGEVYFADPDNALTLAVDAAPPGQVEALHALGGGGAAPIWAGGTGGLLYRFDGAAWIVVDPSKWAATASWNAHHDVHALHASATEVHLVGDGVGIRSGGCRHGFYLHGALTAGTWVFDRLLHFGDQLTDCGTAPFDHVGLRGVTLDHLTDDVYIVGWGPDGPALKERKGLVMRLDKP